MLNEDYRDMLQCLHAEGVKFMLVGGYALAGMDTFAQLWTSTFGSWRPQTTPPPS